ncbi:putative exostosin [Helianthus anomalus]
MIYNRLSIWACMYGFFSGRKKKKKLPNNLICKQYSFVLSTIRRQSQAHDIHKDVLFDIFRCAGISAKKEAPVNFLTDPLEGRSTLRPADILVFGWVGGKHACVDLTGVSPLVGLGNSAFTVGQAALKAASGKVIKHEKACLDNQHVFIPFAFDTFGFLAPEAVDLLSRVQRVMHSNVMTPRSMDVVFKRLSFAIQKGVAAQLVARLPTISM